MNESSRCGGLPRFRLKQESTDRRSTNKAPRYLEAWPSGQGDYFLAGRDTYPIREKIKSVGGRWDGDAKKWYVSRDQAEQLGAIVMVRVIRAPACCEKQLDPDVGIESLATQNEVAVGRMKVAFCPHCDSHIHEHVAIRDLVDTEDLPDLPRTEAHAVRFVAPWEDS